MTPGIEQARRAGIEYRVHQYEHDPGSESYGLEAASKTGVPEAQVFKTLVSAMLNLKLIARAAGAKKAAMAKPGDVERVTGYVLGGVSPLGQKKRLKTYIDASANDFASIYVSAGRRGLEIELAPADLAGLTRANFAALCQ